MSVAEVVWDGADALRAADPRADWVWVRSPSAQARADALERLMDAVATAGDDPVLLASLVVEADGTPRADRLPAGREPDTAAVIDAVSRRLLPIRSAPFASVLLRTALLTEHGVPDAGAFGAHAPVEWSARVLAARPGYLVPDSVVVEPDSVPAAGLAPTLRMARSGAWTRGEGLRALSGAVSGRAPGRRR